jgi:hypothetical protein
LSALGRHDGPAGEVGSRRRDDRVCWRVGGVGFVVMMRMPKAARRTTARVGLAAVLLALLIGTAAADEVYTYRVMHPTFGDIGRYVDRVTRSGDSVQIVSQLRVVVRVLGIVLHREDADRTEAWRGGRLMRFDSVTLVNGDRFDVHGEARDDGFVITTPSGVKVAPLDVVPADPWSARSSADGVLMSTKTGVLEKVKDVRVEDSVIAVLGVEVPTRHYVISTDKRQDVWKDARGVPVLFRTDEKFGAIDFILVEETGVPGRTKTGSISGDTVVGSRP